MAAPPDQTAVETSRHGASDVAGWMDRYGPALRRHFAKRGAAQDAEDLVQEVFLRLQSNAEHTSIDNVERYIFRIANNVLVSRHRHQAVRHRAAQDLPAEALECIDDLSPERVMMGRQAVAQFVVGLRTLPPRARENLFKPFAGSARPGGTGLGLAIARDLMRAQGGDLVLVDTGSSGTAPWRS